MWQLFKNIIFQLFGVKPRQSDAELLQTSADVSAFMDTTKENITAIVTNTLSMLAFSDSSVAITAGKNKTPTQRIELLDKALQKQWDNIKEDIAVGNGCGMIASLPYSVDNGLGRRIYVDTVTKDRILITGYQGDDITKVTVLSDTAIIDNKIYYRWTDYAVENGTYIIAQKATYESKPVELSTVPDWANIMPEIRIAGVDRLPIGIYKCPASNRRPDTMDGVPITYGCNATLTKIANCLTNIEEEFEDKKTKIFADAKLFDQDEKISERLFKSLRSGGKMGENKLIDVFDPAFRETAYFTKLNNHFAMLEKEIGASRGILTDLTTSGATATEIRRATYQTFTLCDGIHRQSEKYIDDLMYGINVLINYYNLAPISDYEINYNWSYAMLEDTDSTFNQLKEAYKMGAADGIDIRQFIIGAETADEAAEKIKQIKLNGGNMSQLDRSKMLLGELASGISKPEEYRVIMKQETPEQAKAMLPNPLNSADDDNILPA